MRQCLIAALFLSGAAAFAPPTPRFILSRLSSGRFSGFVARTGSATLRPRAERWTTLRMSTAAPPATEAGEETFEFQAEVSRVMDIIINSLYSNRDVFLRELISNAADACDKKRFLSITETAEGSAGPDYHIRIRADKDARTLTIEDSGVGMTRDELKANLGRIAQSGTAKFMEALGKGQADVNLIGQFGVGFYSGFLVADKMTVITKSSQQEGAPQLRWESKAGKNYSIRDDDSEPIDGSGTRIVLHLKEDSEEYLDDFKVKELCRRYSEFVSFPIDVWSEQTKYEQVPDPDAAIEEGQPPKMKTLTKTEFGWETMNKMKPIWMRRPKEVTESEYAEFYKSTFKAWDEPVAHSHFSLEGQVEFKALLYVPSVLPFELSRNMFDDSSRNVRLYVKRVFINDKFEELLPRWLMFLRGVVDSEDLPLNVGREILQRSKMLSVINKRLVRKAIDMFKGIEADETKYKTFWDNFGKYLKVGIVEDDDNKDDLAKLCRFYSSKSGDGVTSLQQYVDRMPEKQKAVYFVTGESKAAAKMSPSLEKANKLGYEVLYMTEPLDELTAQAIARFGDKDLIDMAKENVDLDDDNDQAKKLREKRSSELEPFREWLKKVLGTRVQKVEVSSRLVGSPATLVQSAYGMSPTMQRYMRAQAVQLGEDENSFGMGMNQAVLEINADHPVISQLSGKYAAAPDSEETRALAMLVYDVAALTGGYSIDDPAAFAARVTQMMVGEAKVEAGSGSGSSGGDDAAAEEKPQPEEAAAEVEVVSE